MFADFNPAKITTRRTNEGLRGFLHRIYYVHMYITSFVRQRRSVTATNISSLVSATGLLQPATNFDAALVRIDNAIVQRDAIGRGGG
jgi:hypothetical protein